tara:strand:- start:1638 stop:3539 length:1902 start_codon:yes stop_codon:yes gene_type:complete
MDWLSEEFSNLGGNTSEGLRNSLGRPSLEPLEIMIRESVQNSWDAKLPEVDNIFFDISYDKFTESQLSHLKLIISRAPETLPNIKSLNYSNDNTYIILDDRNTEGLTGPVRAKEVEKDQPSDYVDFILKSGSKRDKDFGGGTYGFGKSSLHRISKISTIFIFSKTYYKGSLSSRLIAYSLGDANEKNTGRSWYGKKINSTCVDPIQGDEANKLAEKIGFRNVNRDETGTSILIPFPLTGNKRENEAIKPRSQYECFLFMISSIYWNLWPKMISSSLQKVPAIIFKAFFMSKEYELFHPGLHPQLTNFIQAYFNYEEVLSNKNKEVIKKNLVVETIRHKSMKLDIGILSSLGHTDIEKPILKENNFKADLIKSIYDNSPTNSEKEIRCHHIALMRSAKLVVKYFKGPPKVEGNYSGVFITNRDFQIDEAFAESEPPTHDNWSVKQLEDSDQKKIVKHTFNKLNEKISEMIDEEELQQGSNSNFNNVLNLQYIFGNMLTPFSSGLAPSRKSQGSKIAQIQNNHSQKGYVKILKNCKVAYKDNKKIIYVSFIPIILKSNVNLKLKNTINTCIDYKSIETSSPINTGQPDFLYWIDPENNKILEPTYIVDKAYSNKEWQAVFKVPENITSSVEISLF